MVDDAEADASGESPEPMTQEQIFALLLQIREGSEVGKIAATLRPQRDEIGESLSGWLDLLIYDLFRNTSDAALPYLEEQVARRARSGVRTDGEPDDDVQLTAWRVADTSPAAADLATWRAEGWPGELLQADREQDDGLVLNFAHRVMDAAIDHLRGVSMLLADHKILRPPLALSRTVLDATAHLHHVLSPRISAEERIIRVLNESLSRAGEDYSVAMREGNQDELSKATGEITMIRDAVGTRAKWNWDPKRGSIPFFGDRPTFTSKMIRDMLGSSTLWNSLSGVVHNKEDEGWRLMAGLSLSIDNPHKGQYILLHSFGGFVGMVSLMDVIEVYTGWSLPTVREVNDAVLKHWAAGAGMMDEMFYERARQQRREDGSTERLVREHAEAVAQIEANAANVDMTE